MRLIALASVASILLASGPASAQEWKEYVSRDDFFTVNFPRDPQVKDITYHTEYNLNLPGHLYSVESGANRYSITVVDLARKVGVTKQAVSQTLAELVRHLPRLTLPAADVVEFYVYESWVAGPHKAVVHRSSCSQCNAGKGRPAGHDANHARWHGPLTTLAEAREMTHTLPGVLIRSECKCV